MLPVQARAGGYISINLIYQIMIDVVQYRFRIGTYQSKGAKGRGPGRINFPGQFDDSSTFNPYNRSKSILFLYY